MKIFSHRIGLLLVLCLSGVSLDARTFTDNQGRKIDASVVSVKGGEVELKLDEGGKIYLVPIAKLSDADRNYLKLWVETQGSGDKEKAEDKKPEKPPGKKPGKKRGKKESAEEKRKRLQKLLDQSKPLKLEELVLNKDIWKMTTSDFVDKYKKNGFVYMSAAKNDLRAEGKGFTVFGKTAGEVIVRSENGLISRISISMFNRGDNGNMSVSAFNKTFDGLLTSLNEKTGVTPSDESKTGAVKVERRLWKWEESAILLEKSFSSDGKTPDFLRIRMKSKDAESEGMANRSSLTDHVMKNKDTGDVFIQGVPMVDQGRKGYCAVASAARVYQYYGLEIDQHELAQIAGTGPSSGTTLGEIVAALKKVTRHVHSRVLVLYEYPKGLADKMPTDDASNQDYDRMIRNYNLGLKEFARDVKSYNRIAKKKGKTEFPCDYEKGVVSMDQFFRRCDPASYREVMTSKSSFSRFQSKIQEYIDQGLPVGWCLQLGMFKEGNLPQSFGGHMRLIIGYNNKTKEIIYTDSWGAGHGKKRMPVADAFCMSNALLALPPTR